MDTSIKISCTLIPVSKHSLLLPNSAIAEVLICGELTPPADSPSWLCGILNWQNHDVCVIDFDIIGSTDKSAPISKNTVVIVRNPANEKQTPFFGILAKSIPQVIEANSRNIDRNLHPKNPHSHATSYINISNTEAIIPNIASLINTMENINLA